MSRKKAKIRKKARVHKGAGGAVGISNPPCPTAVITGEETAVINNPYDYFGCSPQEAARMSGNGTANGYDIFRWGEKWEARGDYTGAVMVATTDFVTFLPRTDVEKKVLDASCNGRSIEARRRSIEDQSMINRINTVRWHNLSRGNKDFVDSLFWVPQAPISPLLALANALDD